MKKLKSFTANKARPLPVIVLADVSGSMMGNKIKSLNYAIKEMITSFSNEESMKAEIELAIITFGGSQAKVHSSLISAKNIEWTSLDAAGGTPMGNAFELVKHMIGNKEVIPSRSYTPTIVLVSDGVPTDEWKNPLNQLLSSPRASKAMRFSMAIGEDANMIVLREFLNNEESQVFSASDAKQMVNFFRWVTMSVVSRSKSANPNEFSESLSFDDIEDLEF